MSVTAFLLIYSGAVVIVGPSVLGFLTRSGDAPKFGVAAWLIAVGSVLLTWLTVVVMVIVDVIAHWHLRGSFVVSCIKFLCDMAAGKVGAAPQLMLLAVVVAVIAGVAVTGIRFVRTIGRLRVHAHGHAHGVRLVGRPTTENGVYVIDAAERTAYCVEGKPPAIVVTSAAVAALDQWQLKAVVAHERAHLDGHHLRIVTILRGLAAALPRLALIRRCVVEVVRLLELCADDVAARRYGHGPLLSGLMVLVGGVPAAALGAADVAVLNRAERLALPPAHSARVRAQAVLTSASTIIAVAPLGILVLGASGVLMCGA